MSAPERTATVLASFLNWAAKPQHVSVWVSYVHFTHAPRFDSSAQSAPLVREPQIRHRGRLRCLGLSYRQTIRPTCSRPRHSLGTTPRVEPIPVLPPKLHAMHSSGAPDRALRARFLPGTRFRSV